MCALQAIRRARLRSNGPTSVLLALLLHPVHEADACSDERQEVCAPLRKLPRQGHTSKGAPTGLWPRQKREGGTRPRRRAVGRCCRSQPVVRDVRTSASEVKTYASRTSVRYVRLKRSMKAFCAGFPGWMKSRVMPRFAPRETGARNSGPLSIRRAAGGRTARRAPRGRVPRGGSDREADLDREGLAVPLVQDVERPEAPAVVERVAHEIERPDLVEHRRGDERLAQPRRHPTFRAPRQIQAQRAVHAMDPLVVPRVPVERADRSTSRSPSAVALDLASNAATTAASRAPGRPAAGTTPPAPIGPRGTRAAPRAGAR